MTPRQPGFKLFFQLWRYHNFIWKSNIGHPTFLRVSHVQDLSPSHSSGIRNSSRVYVSSRVLDINHDFGGGRLSQEHGGVTFRTASGSHGGFIEPEWFGRICVDPKMFVERRMNRNNSVPCPLNTHAS